LFENIMQLPISKKKAIEANPGWFFHQRISSGGKK